MRNAVLAAPVLMQAAVGAAADDVPVWVQLLPLGTAETADTRGPYHVTDPQKIISLSIVDGAKLPIDECHATDLAAPKGMPAPARGWIVEMQARDDGIWGRVEWTAQGRRMVARNEYRGISPVFIHDDGKRVIRILRASLVNSPNLRGLAALHSEERSMDLMKELVGLLGLDPANATADQVVEGVKKLKSGGKDEKAMQSQLADVRTALGVAEDGDLVAAAKAAKTAADAGGGDDKVVKALQSEIVTLGNKLKAMEDTGAKAKAEAYVDGAIRDGRVGVKPLRDHYIARHMADAAAVEKEIGSFPKLGPSGTDLVPETKDDAVALNSAETDVAAQLGFTTEEFAKAKAPGATKKENA